MLRILAGGLLLAVLTGLVALFSGPLTLEATWPLVLGAAVALAPGRRGGGRYAAFGVGLAASWLGFLMRVQVLPASPTGRALGVAIPVAVVAVCAALTVARLPLWVGLAGLAAFAGAYDAAFVAAPTEFASASVSAMTSVLLASAIGALGAVLVAPAAVGAQPPSSQRQEPVAADGEPEVVR